jgi:hypothetical protein
MPQAFNPTTLLTTKLLAIAALLAIVVAIFLVEWRMQPDAQQYAAVMQPILFSHKHHVGDVGLDCRYCHTSVEKSSFAGMPSTQICLTCHSQLFKDAPMLAPLQASAASGKPIEWNRVHDLPDFAYFNHGIHVAKGVACIECHGHIDQMPLTSRKASLDMQWCIHCHANAREHVRPLGEVFRMSDMSPLSPQEVEELNRLYRLQDKARLTDCSTCHR